MLWFTVDIVASSISKASLELCQEISYGQPVPWLMLWVTCSTDRNFCRRMSQIATVTTYQYVSSEQNIWIHLDDLDISGDFQKPEDVAVEWDLHCQHCHSLEAKAIAEQNSVLFAPVQAWSAEVFFHVKGMVREWDGMVQELYHRYISVTCCTVDLYLK